VSDELERILALVASGELSPDDAEPLVAAIAEADRGGDRDPGPTPGHVPPPGTALPPAPARAVRIRVTDAGRPVVNLRIPVSLASLAGVVIPGLADPQVARVAQAIRDGETGTILDVRDEDGSGVVIATE
jgi:hypothetical protein